MKILNIIKITASKRHGWFETDQGFNIRKPLGAVDHGNDLPMEDTEKQRVLSSLQETITDGAKRSWWQRFKEWLKKLL